MKSKPMGLLGTFVFHWSGPCEKSTDVDIRGCFIEYNSKTNEAQVDTGMMYIDGKKPFKDQENGGLLGRCSCGEWHEIDRNALDETAAEWCRRGIKELAE